MCKLYVLVEPTPRGWIVRYIGYSEPLSQNFGGEGDGSRESTVPIVNALFPHGARTLALELPIHRNAPQELRRRQF